MDDNKVSFMVNKFNYIFMVYITMLWTCLLLPRNTETDVSFQSLAQKYKLPLHNVFLQKLYQEIELF